MVSNSQIRALISVKKVNSEIVKNYEQPYNVNERLLYNYCNYA